MGKNLSRWRDQTHLMCLRFSEKEETVKHFMTCPQNSATLFWLARMKELEEWFKQHYLIPSLAEGMIYHL